MTITLTDISHEDAAALRDHLKQNAADYEDAQSIAKQIGNELQNECERHDERTYLR